MLAAPLVLWLGQVITLRIFYELSLGRAMLLGIVHSMLTGLISTVLALIAGAIAAYVIYGKIISDPLILLRLILRLIGIEPPF
jgi:ABC-type spermidine/putrescine transport system permease subunit II